MIVAFLFLIFFLFYIHGLTNTFERNCKSELLGERVDSRHYVVSLKVEGLGNVLVNKF